MSEDICDKLVRFNEHKQCISTDLEVEAAAEITRLRNDLRNAIFSERDYVKEIERQDVLLREENARLREALKTFALKAPVQLTYEGKAFIKAIPVSESELEAARDALKEPGDEKTGI